GIHTSGDFYSAPYITMWAGLCDVHLEHSFYAYTRSWRVPELQPALNQLRARPNMTLWASTDDTTGPGPQGWPEATIGHRSGYVQCPEQTGRRAICSVGGLCGPPRLKPAPRRSFSVPCPCHSVVRRPARAQLLGPGFTLHSRGGSPRPLAPT